MVGRPNKEAFYKSLLWVHKNHPLALALNLNVLGDLGWFKDLLEILSRVLQDSIIKKREEEKRMNSCWNRSYWSFCNESYEEEEEKEEKEEINTITDVQIARAKAAVDRYRDDPEYRFLHDRVSDVFVEMLASDLRFLNSDEIEKNSYASKFCPSIDSSYDRATLICENIAKRMFPRDDYEEYIDLEEAHYAYRVRDRLRKQVLIPLRKALSLECSLAAKQNRKSLSLFKNRKALIALEDYRNIAGCHDGGGNNESKLKFKSRMNIVQKLVPKKAIIDMCFGDEVKLPHHVLASLEKEQGGVTETAEVQWQRLVKELSSKGKLRNCVAVCDVPESMRGTLKEKVCISMGLLISDLSKKPWKGSVFSFSKVPMLKRIEGEDLQSKCEFMRSLESAEKVDFLKIYNQILQTAIVEKQSNAKIPRRIFVFTYKDFTHATKNNWVEDYKEAWANYKKSGYWSVPELVFWNLKDSIAEPRVFGAPVKNHKGGMIITGFSDILLSLFFKGESDSRSYAGQLHSVYGIDVLPAMKLAPRVEDVMNWAVFNTRVEEPDCIGLM
ncbi:hypothetical protein ACFXTH_034920 [Malus domestica]|uniref:Uncharacterized protein n=1 Tax=Malus domestica TaxID=3750 RepID=A0A498JVM9_MALDO|nr:hypothetical protein DVH24_007858 [Malus domestica]